MIRQYGHNPVKPIEDHADNIVHPLDRFYFLLNTSHVPGFIGSFYMQVEEVKVTHRGKRVPRFCIVIRIEEPGCARDPDHFHSCTAPDAL